MGRLQPGTAACDTEGCDWTTSGPDRFHAAVEHREATGHERVPASLSDGPDDDTGRRVSGAFHNIRRTLR